MRGKLPRSWGAARPASIGMLPARVAPPTNGVQLPRARVVGYCRFVPLYSGGHAAQNGLLAPKFCPTLAGLSRDGAAATGDFAENQRSGPAYQHARCPLRGMHADRGHTCLAIYTLDGTYGGSQASSWAFSAARAFSELAAPLQPSLHPSPHRPKKISLVVVLHSTVGTARALDQALLPRGVHHNCGGPGGLADGLPL